MKIENYYLDVKKVDQVVERSDKERIYDMYRDMVYSYQDGRETVGMSFFNTLYKGGYLICMRQEKIDEILSEDNSVSS